MTDKYELYYLPNCTSCMQVIRFLLQSNIEIEMKSTSEPENEAFLLANASDLVAPILFVNGVAACDGDQIIAYFESRKEF
jgi:glutaredoxin